MKKTICYAILLLVMAGLVSALPAPMPFYVSDDNPSPGETITYTYRIEAQQMGDSYRNMIHFVDDSENIIRNDDHWISEAITGLWTGSSAYDGYIEYQRTVQIPSDFEGRLRIITGMYPWDGITDGPRVALDPRYVTDFGSERYLVKEINVVQPKTAPRVSSIFDTTPAQGQTITYTLSYDAVPMDKNYRTMVHFTDDAGNILVNDDHWINDVKGFTTNSGSFNGYISYTRTITIPSYFNGHLKVYTGFYELIGDTAGPSAELDDRNPGVTDLGYGRYQIGDVYVSGVYQLTAPRAVTLPTNLSPGDWFNYVLAYDAVPMNDSYRTMVHFTADDGTIIINDDHNVEDYIAFTTWDQRFKGFLNYQKTVQIPSNFTGGHLKMYTGFYKLLPDNLAGESVELDDRNAGVTDIGWGRYKLSDLYVNTPVPTITAPKDAAFSDTTPKVGESLTYTINLEAAQMDKDYRTFVHFLDDNDDIILNDDHWIQNVTGFGTGSPSFSRSISYDRTVTIPFDMIAGNLRVVIGYYSYDNGIEGNRINLSTKYVPDIGWNRYLIGQLSVQGNSADYYQLPATYGRISWFASDAGGSCTASPSGIDCWSQQYTCGGSRVYSVDECCNAGNYAHQGAFGDCLGEAYDDEWYAAMRWPYVDAPENIQSNVKSWWHNRKIKITNPANGKSVILAAKDWGPNEATGRVIDVSKRAMNELGVVTDNNVQIEFADQGAPLGPVVVASPYPLSGKTIVLDPGHGDGYPGAVGADGEAESAHAISAKLKVLLQNLGATVYETPSDYDVNQRASYANSLGADIFLSIHFNGGDASVTGVESFYGAVNNAAADGSPANDFALCQNIVPEVKNILGSTLRPSGSGIKPDTDAQVGSLAVLRYTNMPACLIEIEFISAQKNILFKNIFYSDYKSLFLSNDYQNEAAEALRDSILRYYNIALSEADFGGDDDSYNLAEEIDNSDLNPIEDTSCSGLSDFKGFFYPIDIDFTDKDYSKRPQRTQWAGSYIPELINVPYSGRHPGVDLDDGLSNGLFKTVVVSIGDGRVVKVYTREEYEQHFSGWGAHVIIRHDNVPDPSDACHLINITSIYAHLNTTFVSLNEQVTGGQPIGIMGTTGYSTGDHLHFQIDKDSDAVINPYSYNWPSWADKNAFGGKRWNVPERLSVFLEQASDPSGALYSPSHKTSIDNNIVQQNYPVARLSEITINPLPYLQMYPPTGPNQAYMFGNGVALKYFIQHPDGTIVQEAGSDHPERMYYIDEGKLRYIPKPQFIKENGLEVIAKITPDEFNSYPMSNKELLYPDGTIFQYNGEYYIISEGTKRKFVKSCWLCKQPYKEYGYKLSQFIPISTEDFNKIPWGRDLPNGEGHPDGAYVYNTNDDMYYIIEWDYSAQEAVMRPIYHPLERQYLGLEENGQQGYWLRSSVALAVDSLPYRKGERISLRSGTLVKPLTERSVYLVYGDKLRRFQDEKSFKSAGYLFEQVIELPDNVFAALPFEIGDNITLTNNEVLRQISYNSQSDAYNVFLADMGGASSVEAQLLDADMNSIGSIQQAQVQDYKASLTLAASNADAVYLNLMIKNGSTVVEEHLDPLLYVGSKEKIGQEITNSPLVLEYSQNTTALSDDWGFEEPEDIINSTPVSTCIDYSAEGDVIIENSCINLSTLSNVHIKDSSIIDSEISGFGSGLLIEDAVISDNVMHSGRISWNGLYFEGRLDLSKINLDCMATTNVDISGQTKMRLCSGDYNDNINISSSNVEVDFNGAVLTGGVLAYSGYNQSEVIETMKGLDPLKLSRQEINDLIDTIPRFENITLKNGIFNGKGLNLSAVKNAVILDNEFTDSGLFLGAVNSEVKGNTFIGSGDNALLVGGGDSLIINNNISGNFGQGIAAAGFNITVDSNTISGTNKGIGSLGMWHNFLNNGISAVNEGISGLFFVESNISGNTIKADYGIKGTCIGAQDISNNIFETTDGIKLNKFLKNKCSKENSFTQNCFVGSDSIDIMGKILFNEDDAYGTLVQGNVAADDARECQDILDQQNKFSNPLFWQHQYNVIYEPGELRDISDVELTSNIKNVSSWDIVDMQEIDGFYYFGFDDISAGEKVLNLRYMVQSVSYDYYYAVSTQGLSGTIYINGEPLDCGYAHYFPPSSANYKVVMDGEGGFSPSSSGDKLQGCDQLCSEDKLSQRVLWSPSGELEIPAGVFTGNAYENNTSPPSLFFDFDTREKSWIVSGAFDAFAENIPFLMDADGSAITGPMKSQYESSASWRWEDGITPQYKEGNNVYSLDVNPCHPDVILEIFEGKAAHHIKPPD